MRPPPKTATNMLSAYRYVYLFLWQRQSYVLINKANGFSASDNSYGFANRVAEGMSLYINTLEMEFTSEMFGGSIMVGTDKLINAD